MNIYSLLAGFQTTGEGTNREVPRGALKPGDALRAEVTASRDGVLLLRASNGWQFTALAQIDRPLVPGQMVELTVTGSKNGQPIVEISEDGGVKLGNFLYAMGAENTPENTELAREVIAQKADIDKKQFAGLVNAMKSFPGLKPSQAVFMLRHSIPVNPKTVEQYRQLQQPEGQLGAKLNTLLEALGFKGELQQAVQLPSQLPDQTEQATASPNQPLRTAQMTDNQSRLPQNIPQPIADTADPQQPQAQQNTQSSAQISQQTPNQPLQATTQPELPQQTAQLSEPQQRTPQDVPQAQTEATEPQQQQTDNLRQPATQSIELPEQARQANAKPGLPQKDRTDNSPRLEQSQLPESKELEVARLADKLFRKISPERGTALPREMDAVRITKELGDLIPKALEYAQTLPGEQKSAVQKAVVELVETLRFTEQMGNAAAFVQIPIQFGSERTTAQLYVFGDKKERKRIDPNNATMFVSLATANIGQVEGFLSIIGRNVEADFTLENEASSALLTRHMPELNAMLEAYGYRLARSSAKIRDKQSEPTDAERECIARQSKSRFDLKV